MMVSAKINHDLAVAHNLSGSRSIRPPATLDISDLSAQTRLAKITGDAATFGAFATIAMDVLATPSLDRAASEMQRYLDLGTEPIDKTWIPRDELQ